MRAVPPLFPDEIGALFLSAHGLVPAGSTIPKHSEILPAALPLWVTLVTNQS